MTNIDVAIFLAIIGCYGFQILAWRALSNHVASKLDKLTQKVDVLTVEVTNRLTALETAFKAAKKE